MIKQKYIDLGRTIKLYNVSLFKNPRTYVVGIILPIVIAALLQFLWSRYSNLELTSPEMLSFMYVPVIISAFYIGIVSNESRRNNFNEKVNIKLNNMNIIKYTMVILVIEMTMINIFLTTILFYIISQFNIASFDKELFNNLMAFVWVYYAIFGLMLGIMAGVIFLLIETIFNNKIWAISLMSLAFILMLIFSDTVIPAKVFSNNNAMTVIGYFNPIKYVTWSMDLISSYQFEDKLGKYQIYVEKNGSFEPFNMLWQTTVPATIILILLIVGYGYRKEDK